MPGAPEMHSFDREVGRDENFVAGRNPQDSAVVPDTRDHAAPSGGTPTNTGNQRSFA
jgi:hypothetical protein